MGDVNGSSKNKKILFSIGSYREEKKKINKITAAELFSTPNSVPPSPTNYQPIKLQFKERPTSLDITDAPLFNNLENQASRRLTFQNGQVKEEVEKPNCPPNLNKDKCFVKAQCELLDKPVHPPQLYQRSVSLEPEQLRHSGKVALTIAAYEGEPKTPTRLDFLPPQTKLSRSSSKASDLTTSPAGDDLTDSINSRLQNELVATLKRSNLKKRHDTVVENGKADETESEEKEEIVKDQSNGDNVSNGNVQKLVGELTKTLTFRFNTEEQ